MTVDDFRGIYNTSKPFFRMSAAVATDRRLYGVTYVRDKNCYAGDYRLETEAAAASDVVVKYFTKAGSPKYKMAETRRT